MVTGFYLMWRPLGITRAARTAASPAGRRGAVVLQGEKAWMMRRSAPGYLVLPLLLSLSGCGLLQQATPPAAPPVQPVAVARTEQPRQEPAEVIPPEPPKPHEEPLLHKSRLKGSRSRHLQAAGKPHYPLLTSRGYEEKGIASWYGPSFQGRRTSCGEIFDMRKISAAHKLLPMHTHVQVTNLENGKSIDLTVNDRGPYFTGRVLDLSYGAAKVLGVVDKGLARVSISTSGPVPGERGGDLVGEFLVHIGSFEKEADALILLKDMKSRKYKQSLLKVIKSRRGGETRFRVEVGPYQCMSAANKAHSRVICDYPSAFVIARQDDEIFVAGGTGGGVRGKDEVPRKNAKKLSLMTQR